MARIRKILQIIPPVVPVLLIAAILRFIWIDRIPNGINGDELIYALNAKAIILRGSDITGVWNPFSAFLFRYPPNQMQAELPYFLNIPFSGLFPFSLITARLPFVLLSIGIVYLVYLVGRRLLNERIALLAALLSAVNPYLLLVGRSGYDMTPAVFFFLAGLYLLLDMRPKAVLASLPAFVLAFYSYIGTKIILAPFVILGSVFGYLYVGKHRLRNQYISVSLSAVLLVMVYAILISSGGTNRLTEVTGGTHQTMSAYATGALGRIFAVFSPEYLFVTGDKFFSSFRHGLMFIPDLFLFSVGLAALFRTRRRSFGLLILLLILSFVPHIAHVPSRENFSAHISLTIPFFMLIIASGIDMLITDRNRTVSTFAAVSLLCIYGFFTMQWLYLYFFQFPLTDHFDTDSRILANYLRLASDERKPVTVYTQSPIDVFQKYLFYSDSLTRASLHGAIGQADNGSFSAGLIHFRQCDESSDATGSGIAIFNIVCSASRSATPAVYVPRLIDGGRVYAIYGDSICSGYDLQKYPSALTLSDLTMESLPAKRFCTEFITD